MTSAGVKVDSALVSMFDELKIRHTQAFLVAKIVNKQMVQADQSIPPRQCHENDRALNQSIFQELKEQLQDDEPRYIVFDFRFTTDEGQIVNKLAFIFWCSDNCGVGSKMIYASTKDSVKKLFKGLAVEFQASEKDDLDYDRMASEIEKKK